MLPANLPIAFRHAVLALVAVLVGLTLTRSQLWAEDFDPLQFPDASWQRSTPDDWQFSPSDDKLADIPQSFPAASVAFGWLAPGGATGFGSADLDVHYTWEVGQAFDREPLLITPGLGFHLWSGPEVLDLPPRVYDLYVDLSWRAINRDHSGLTLGLTPGYYGDFERLDSKAFQFTGWLLGDWTLNERWTLLGGLAYVRQLKSNLLPIGGLIWRPHDDARVDLVFPRPRVARRLAIDETQETWGYISGVFGGGAWAVDDGDRNVLVRYSDLRLGMGVEWLRTDGGSTQVELGYVFARDISVNQFSVLSPGGTALFQVTTSF
jgi:hypothetical protein